MSPCRPAAGLLLAVLQLPANGEAAFEACRHLGGSTADWEACLLAQERAGAAFRPLDYAPAAGALLGGATVAAILFGLGLVLARLQPTDRTEAAPTGHRP